MQPHLFGELRPRPKSHALPRALEVQPDSLECFFCPRFERWLGYDFENAQRPVCVISIFRIPLRVGIVFIDIFLADTKSVDVTELCEDRSKKPRLLFGPILRPFEKERECSAPTVDWCGIVGQPVVTTLEGTLMKRFNQSKRYLCLVVFGNADAPGEFAEGTLWPASWVTVKQRFLCK